MPRRIQVKKLNTLLMTALLAATAVVSQAATTYTWNAASGGDFTVATNWTPTRTTPAADDVLVFDGTAPTNGTLTVTAMPSQTIGELHIINNGYLKLQTTASQTLTIAGDASSKDLEVAAGSTLELNGATQVIISVGAAATGVINGDVLYTCTAVPSVGMQLRSAAVDGIVFESGSSAAMAPAGGSGGGGFAAGIASGVRFKAGAEFHHGGTKTGVFNGGTGSNAFVASPALTVWDSASTYYIEEGLPSVSGRTYGNLTWRAGVSQTSSGGASAFTVNGNLVFAPSTPKATAGTWTLNAQTAAITVNGNFVIQSGTNATGFVDGTLASAANFNLNGNVDIQDATKFTPSASVNRTYVLGGASSQNVNFAGLNLINLTLNNAAGAVLTGNVGVTGTLALTAGSITTGANKVTLGPAATVTGTGKIIGTVARTADATVTGARVVPIFGAAGDALPVTFDITAAGTGTGAFSANTIAAPTQTLPAGATGISRAWNLDATGITGATVTLTVTYLDADLGAATESALQLARWNGSSWDVYPATSINTTNNTATLTGVTSFSEWTLLVPSASVQDWRLSE